MSLAQKPFSFVDFAIAVEVRAYSMSHVVFDFSCILIFSPPGSFFLAACLEQTEEVFMRIPVIESLTMEHVISVEAVVILFVLKYFECQAVSPAIFELPIVDISIDPHSSIA